MFQSKVVGAVVRAMGVAALLVTLASTDAGAAKAVATTPQEQFQISMGNAAQKKFVVIDMHGTNVSGKYFDVWRSNPNSGSLVETQDHPGSKGHVYINVLDRVVYERIDAAQWKYAGIPAKYKSYEDKWFILRKSSASYSTFLQQVVTSGSLLIPINGTQFTIQISTKLHGVKVIGLEGALTGSNPAVPVTLCISKAKNPLPLEVYVPRTAKNKDVWTATYAFRTSASPIAKPTTSLIFP